MGAEAAVVRAKVGARVVESGDLQTIDFRLALRLLSFRAETKSQTRNPWPATADLQTIDFRLALRLLSFWAETKSQTRNPWPCYR